MIRMISLSDNKKLNGVILIATSAQKYGRLKM